MRVALVVHRFPERSEAFLVDHALGLLGAGIDVHVVAGEVDEAAVDPDLRGRVHAMPAGAHRRSQVALRAAPGALRHPLRATRHLVRTRSPVALARDLPLLALRPDVVHTEFLTLAVERAHLPRLLGCRLTSSIRGYDVAYAGLDRPGFYDGVWPALAAVHVLGADLWARARERGCPDDLPHALIPPAVDVDAVPRATPDRPGPLRLVSVGRLHWKKGHHHVLRALALARVQGLDARLRIVGDGPDLEAVAFARHQLGLDDAVELVRDADRPAARTELAGAHLLLHGAVSEGFGNAVLEAQAAGLPVVCTDAEGLAENVEPGRTGLVVPRRDPEAMAAALLELAGDPARRRAMGDAGRRRVAERFRPADQVAAFVRFFEDVVS